MTDAVLDTIRTDRDKELVGIVSLGDPGLGGGDRTSMAMAAEGIVQPTGKHEQWEKPQDRLSLRHSAALSTGRGFDLPLDTPPMEAALAETIPIEGGPWQYEPKWDGFRCLSFKADDRIEMRAKSGKPLGRYFPEMTEALARIDVPRFVLDGELVIEIDGRFSFEALQMRLHPAESRVRKLARETPATLIVFDILLAPNAANLMRQPLWRRRAALEALMAGVAPAARLLLSPMTRAAEEAEHRCGGRRCRPPQCSRQADGCHPSLPASTLPGVRSC